MEAPTHHPDRDARPLVIFAIEPRSYAQTIGEVVAQLRPGLEVLVVEPGDLVAEIQSRAPALVFCSERKPDGCDEAVRWAQFNPYDEPEVVRVDGRAENFSHLDLEDLLGLIDRLAMMPRRG